MKRLAIASHVALIDGKEYDGIGNALQEALSTTSVDYYFVKHSMEGNMASSICAYMSGKEEGRGKLRFVIRRPGPLRYVTELIATVVHFSFSKKVDVYIGIDPLNALAAVLLRKLGRVQYCVFYTPDYSEKRFGSNLLNNVYHAIDRYCVRNADEVWSVSTKITEIRRSLGLSEEKNILVPNVPPAKFAPLQKNKKHEHTLIMYGIVDTQLDFEGSIRAVKALSKKYDDIQMYIVGNGPEETRLKQLAKTLDIDDRIQFMGRKPLADTLELASKSGIGLALYTGEWAFNAYGDSTKCREYFFFGLPVISTDSHATVPEIIESEAGIIVEQDVQKYVEAIEQVFADYATYSHASKALGKKYSDTHKKLILNLLSS